MQKVISYAVINCRNVREYLDKGWQPWGSALINWNGRNNVPHQPMVKYKEDAKEDDKEDAAAS